MYTLVHLASLHMDLGQKEEAGKVLEEARQITELVPRDESRRPRQDALSKVYAALGRFHAMNGSATARDWYRKSLDSLDEMVKAGAEASRLTERRREIEKAMASAK